MGQAAHKPAALKEEPLKEEPLKEPEMPDIKVPADFIQAVRKNREEAKNFEMNVKKMREDL
jgi:hypothetical protein